MIFKATLANRVHPEYGQATIPFPITASEYDISLALLRQLGIGSPITQDCRVEGISGSYPILNRLAAQSVNVDELDYLAKRLGSFSGNEDAQFQAMAFKLGLSDIRDLINLTFCCQETTVITNFSNLERAGKAHSLTINGGSMPMEEYDKVDGLAVALDLIQSGTGVVTPYGAVFDNGMKLEPVYDGNSFPMYQYADSLLTIGVPIQRDIGGPVDTAWLYLPAPEQQITRTLHRIGIANNDTAYYIEDSTLPPGILEVIECPDDAIFDLNRMCQAVSGLDAAALKKLEAVVMMAQPTGAGEIRQLAENLEQFDFVPSVESPERNSQVTRMGYVAYHGSLTLEELMREDPAEQYRQEQEMGGMM